MQETDKYTPAYYHKQKLQAILLKKDVAQLVPFLDELFVSIQKRNVHHVMVKKPYLLVYLIRMNLLSIQEVLYLRGIRFLRKYQSGEYLRLVIQAIMLSPLKIDEKFRDIALADLEDYIASFIKKKPAVALRLLYEYEEIRHQIDGRYEKCLAPFYELMAQAYVKLIAGSENIEAFLSQPICRGIAASEYSQRPAFTNSIPLLAKKYPRAFVWVAQKYDVQAANYELLKAIALAHTANNPQLSLDAWSLYAECDAVYREEAYTRMFEILVEQLGPEPRMVMERSALLAVVMKIKYPDYLSKALEIFEQSYRAVSLDDLVNYPTPISRIWGVIERVPVPSALEMLSLYMLRMAEVEEREPVNAFYMHARTLLALHAFPQVQEELIVRLIDVYKKLLAHHPNKTFGALLALGGRSSYYDNLKPHPMREHFLPMLEAFAFILPHRINNFRYDRQPSEHNDFVNALSTVKRRLRLQPPANA